jgi:hypothetical protein
MGGRQTKTGFGVGSEIWFLQTGHEYDYPVIPIRSPKKQTGIPDRLFPLQ